MADLGNAVAFSSRERIIAGSTTSYNPSAVYLGMFEAKISRGNTPAFSPVTTVIAASTTSYDQNAVYLGMFENRKNLGSNVGLTTTYYKIKAAPVVQYWS